MRFMVIRRGDKDTEAGKMPDEELIAAMGRYNEEMVKAGIMLEGAGLKPTAKGALVRFKNGTPTVIDGPFTEAKELVAGYSIIDVPSKAEAIALVRRWPKEDGDVEIEIRELYEMADFGPSPAIDHMIEVGFAKKK